MRKSLLPLALACALTASASGGHDYPITPVPFTSVHLEDDFWAPRIQTNQKTTIPIALEQCYITGRVDNFLKAAGTMPGYFNTEFTFDDTDLYKIIEGISYSIQMFPNAELEAEMDKLIAIIGAAQEPDGYLYTPRTAGKPDEYHSWVGAERWEKTPDLSHELYNSGHLYEAAVAHFQATGKRSLLDIAIKNADLLVRDFGPGKLDYEPGHQIVEMGLAKMYRATGRREYLDLAKYFLDLRGHGVRGEYSQSHKPVTEQDEAVGHAVRAGYMYSGMADVAALTGDRSYVEAIDRIWDNVVQKKLYVTGGIGSTAHGEAFGPNYDLPNMSAYCETCAAIANVYWNHRLFLLHGESKYYDVLERTLYNGLIAGIGLSGDRFFYPNPLQSMGQHSRSEWFGCACCPSNMCRFTPSVSGYMYAVKDDAVYVNMFAESSAKMEINGNTVGVAQVTGYPWDGNVAIKIDPSKKRQSFRVKVRIPGWAQGRPVPGDLYRYLNDQPAPVSVKVNGSVVDAAPAEDGYVTIERAWNAGDRIELELPMEVRYTVADGRVEADRGRVSLERGPIVYCLEWPDNGGEVLNTIFPDGTQAVCTNDADERLGNIRTLTAKAQSARRNDAGGIIIEDKTITAIPYYSWANRGAGEMMVWIPRTADFSLPQPPKTISTTAAVSASTVNPSLKTVNDGYWPSNSNDRDIPYYSIWPARNSSEWIEYRFESPQNVSMARVYWYDDAPWGGTRIPESWSISYLGEEGEWRDAEFTTPVGAPVKDCVDERAFVPVKTSAVRLNFTMPEKESTAIYEFEVK